MFFLLVLSWPNEISSWLAPHLKKCFWSPLGKIHCWSPLEKILPTPMPVASNDEFSTNSCTLPRFVPAVFVNRFSRFVFISPILQHDAISARHHLARFVHREHMSVGINYLVLQIEVVYKNAMHARVDDVCNTHTGKFCVPGCNELESL